MWSQEGGATQAVPVAWGFRGRSQAIIKVGLCHAQAMLGRPPPGKGDAFWFSEPQPQGVPQGVPQGGPQGGDSEPMSGGGDGSRGGGGGRRPAVSAEWRDVEHIYYGPIDQVTRGAAD